MYFATAKELSMWQPLPKFLCVKAIVFFSYWQGFVLSILASLGILRYFLNSEDQNLPLFIQNAMICVEMVIAAVGHYIYFSHKEYAPKSSTTAARMRLYYAFSDAFGIKDVIEDARQSWSGSTYTYSHFEPIVQLDELDSPLLDTESTVSNESSQHNLKKGLNHNQSKHNTFFSSTGGLDSETTSLILNKKAHTSQAKSDYISTPSSKTHSKNILADKSKPNALESFNSSNVSTFVNNQNLPNNALPFLNKTNSDSAFNSDYNLSTSFNSARNGVTKSVSNSFNSKNPLFVSQKRLKAGMRYAKGGEKTYWISKDSSTNETNKKEKPN
ncbi:hypothetical protein BB561_001863 [Smittium simulii]|uniref:Uncharacterized protein n=1 Tax=Smittium simulii TaxID=133385 RepID=A0A2T9YSR8_9FUNG|nr:hypothetical protein BB561_001863 [Smittium simulii]